MDQRITYCCESLTVDKASSILITGYVGLIFKCSIAAIAVSMKFDSNETGNSKFIWFSELINNLINVNTICYERSSD